jgi:hypothetical protein
LQKDVIDHHTIDLLHKRLRKHDKDISLVRTGMAIQEDRINQAVAVIADIYPRVTDGKIAQSV